MEGVPIFLEFRQFLFACVNILAEWRILIYHFEKIVFHQKVWYDFFKMDKGEGNNRWLEFSL